MTWFAPISSTTAVTAAGDGHGVFIGPSVTLSVSGASAINLNSSNETLDIYGTVVSTTATAILLGSSFSGEHGQQVDIHAGAFVRGYGDSGMYIRGFDSRITNAGDVAGLNQGLTLDFGPGAPMVVNNSGAISGSMHYGIFVMVTSSGTLVVNNSGLIRGPQGSLDGVAGGSDIVTNTGTMIGNIKVYSGDDYYNGARGHLYGHLDAGAGTDTIIGGTDNDWFEGGPDGDTLMGNAGKDLLKGDDGSDTLFGGIGVDTLTGGLNNDYFVFNTPLNALTNRDTVTDFSHVDDTFKLENAIFTKLGAGVHALNPAFFRAAVKALDANDYIVYDRTHGTLSYDADGNGAHAAIAFAYLPTKPVLAANDFVVI
jgi:Ca2+-binding RTX toxin-like protein